MNLRRRTGRNDGHFFLRGEAREREHIDFSYVLSVAGILLGLPLFVVGILGSGGSSALYLGAAGLAISASGILNFYLTCNWRENKDLNLRTRTALRGLKLVCWLILLPAVALGILIMALLAFSGPSY